MEKSEKIEKTNVMRILDQKKIEYIPHRYDPDETVGENVAALLGKPPEQTFKTLVTVANTKAYYVFVIPVNLTLDLKKAAKAVNVKSIEMIKQKDLLPLTGYIHGGCSPIGMKKSFVTTLHESALLYDKIMFSAGKRGCQVEMSPNDLIKLVRAQCADIAQ